MGRNKMTCLVFLAMLLLVAPHASQALTCGQVVNWMLPCLGVLKGGGGPSGVCCTNVKSLNSAASTTPTRRVACACLKQAAQSFGVNYDYANALPPKCNVHVAYKLSPTLDCNKIN